MAVYYGDLYDDLPKASKCKRAVFYSRGLKVYGMLPHLLNRRLKGEFRSNHVANGPLQAIAPTLEANYTVVPYRQSPANTQRLMDWLLDGVGFEWAIASPQDWSQDILLGNAFQYPPKVWHPSPQGEQREGFARALALEPNDILALSAALGVQVDVG